MRNARVDKAQAGTKIAGRNINNLRYADDTTIMAESEELKSFLILCFGKACLDPVVLKCGLCSAHDGDQYTGG